MLATAIIIFREVLEAALIITVVLAATRGIASRQRWILGGLVTGLALSGLVAMLAEQISMLADGIGQELFNALILLVAVTMLSWHNVWMKKHAGELVQQIKSAGHAISLGEKSMLLIATIVGLAVLREGAEVVLFMYSMLAAGTQTANMLLGGLLGLALGIGTGGLLYFGLLRIPTRYLFKVTGIMILLLAAGLAAQAAGYLVQADILPALGNRIWDTSGVLSEKSVLGNLLHILIGYDANPMGIQIVFYVFTLTLISSLMVWVSREGKPVRNIAVTACVSLFALSIISHSDNAYASHKVYSPHVEEGETELELRGHTTFDSRSTQNDQQQYLIEIGYGINQYWFSSVFGEIEKNQQGEMEYEATAWENIFQLTEQGEHWVDMGLYLEYEHAHESYNNNKAELKLLLEKASGKWLHTFNLNFERELGNNAPGVTNLGYAWRSSLYMSKGLSPALEIYGNTGELGSPQHSKDQDHRAGPVIHGEFRLGNTDKMAYELGYLVGLTNTAPDGTLKFSLEYEF